MLKLRLVILGASAAVVLGTGSAFASVATTGGDGNSDSHGDSVASAARTTCPHGPGDAHGDCVSAIASSNAESKTEDACKAGDRTEDASEKAGDRTEDSAEKSGHASKAGDHAEDKSERAADRTEDKAEKAKIKACEAASHPSD